jgi:hypothetical protein
VLEHQFSLQAKDGDQLTDITIVIAHSCDPGRFAPGPG